MYDELRYRERTVVAQHPYCEPQIATPFPRTADMFAEQNGVCGNPGACRACVASLP
jgi:hypothetical protein